MGEGWTEPGPDVHTLLCTKWMPNDNLQYSTGHSTQGSLVTETGRKSEKEGLYVYMQYAPINFVFNLWKNKFYFIDSLWWPESQVWWPHTQEQAPDCGVA